MKQLKIRIPVLGTRLVFFGADEGYMIFGSELLGKLIKGEHSPKEREYALIDGDVLLSRKVITDTGVAFLVNDWFDGSKDQTNFNAHGNGTGTVAENVTDTALGTEVETRVAGTKSKPSAPQLRSVATISITATRAITEHGLFDSTTASGSTLWDRSVFTAINVVNGDSIQFTYTCTVNSGG
jgi:hypothetical protein